MGRNASPSEHEHFRKNPWLIIEMWQFTIYIMIVRE